jgi:hypothetical protein
MSRHYFLSWKKYIEPIVYALSIAFAFFQKRRNLSMTKNMKEATCEFKACFAGNRVAEYEQKLK